MSAFNVSSDLPSGLSELVNPISLAERGTFETPSTEEVRQHLLREYSHVLDEDVAVDIRSNCTVHAQLSLNGDGKTYTLLSPSMAVREIFIHTGGDATYKLSLTGVAEQSAFVDGVLRTTDISKKLLLTGAWPYTGGCDRLVQKPSHGVVLYAHDNTSIVAEGDSLHAHIDVTLRGSTLVRAFQNMVALKFS